MHHLVAALGQPSGQRQRHLLHAAAVQVGEQKGDPALDGGAARGGRLRRPGVRRLPWLGHPMDCSHGRAFIRVAVRAAQASSAPRRHGPVPDNGCPDRNPHRRRASASAAAVAERDLERREGDRRPSQGSRIMKLHSNPASPFGRKVKVLAHETGLFRASGHPQPADVGRGSRPAAGGGQSARAKSLASCLRMAAPSTIRA